MSDETQHDQLSLVTISEFAGQYPDVPLAPGVDIEAIRSDDPDPFFVTLPVCRVGAKSKNGLTYGLSANQQIAEQINAKKPEGGLGHIPVSEIATRYDLPAWRAVGASVVNDTTWAKFYVPKHREDVRDHLRLAMRTNARAAVSVWGSASIDKNNEVKLIDIQRVDVADPERSGLPVAARPIITSEMADPNAALAVKDNDMTDDVNVLQTRVSEMEARVKELEPLEGRVKLIAEMAQTLGVDEAAIPQRISEMVTELNTYRTATKKATAEAKIAELVTLEELRPVVIANMGPAETWDLEKIADTVKGIMEKPEIVTLAEMVVKAKAGGAVALGALDNRQQADKDAEFEKQARADAKRMTGRH